MADYKAIHGKNIQSLASDLDNAEGEGQIWFNTTSNDFKTIVKVVGAWSTGGALNTGRVQAGSSIQGTNTATIVFGGYNPGAPNGQTNNESYDGSAWTEVADLNNARWSLSGFGISTSAMAAMGANPNSTSMVNYNETWDGSSWTEVADLNTSRRVYGSAGATSTAGIIFGGRYPNSSYHAVTESWNGSAWTEVADLNTARSDMKGSGTQTSAIFAGGDTGSRTAN